MYRNVCIFLLFAVFQLVLGAANFRAGLDQLDLQCIERTGVDLNHLKTQIATNIYDVSGKRDISCYLLCVGMKKGQVYRNGTINMEFVRKNPGPGMTPKIIDSFEYCAKKEGENPCKTLQKGLSCVFQMLTIAFMEQGAV